MSSFFSRTKYVEGGDIEDVRITFENLIFALQDKKYDEGVDAETIILTIRDIYGYVTGTSRGKALRLPAPANDPEDKYNTMWPEGAKVRTRSRRDSHTSRASSVTSNGVRVPRISNAYTNSRASSNTSSRYAPVKAKFIEDEAPEQVVRSFDMRDIRAAVPSQSRGLGQPQGRPSMNNARGNSYDQNIEYGPPPTRAKPRFMPEEPLDEEMEQIETRASVPRERVPSQRSEARRSRKPTFIEDE